jgi:mRNA-degrading endonuclease RelE of RelBE toxin-antitoxin system
MDRIDKFLRRLSPKEFAVTEGLIDRILSGDVAGLDVKRLKDAPHLFRVRKGSTRVVFQRKEGVVHIIEIGRRGEQTYRHLTK